MKVRWAPNLDPEVVMSSLKAVEESWRFLTREASLTTRGSGARHDHPRGQRQTLVLMALAANVHEMAQIIRPALPDRLTVAHMPIVRAIYETTLTLVWCDEVDDGIDAILNEEARQRSCLADEMLLASSWAGGAETVRLDWDELESTSNPHARRVGRLADDIALDGAYVLYRVMSHFSHPSIKVFDSYDDGTTGIDGASPTLSVSRHPFPLGMTATLSHIVVSCLVWSTTVINFMDPARSQRDELRKLARNLGIPDGLPVTTAARLRGAKKPGRNL